MVPPEKEEKFCQSRSEAALVSPKVTFIDETMENMEKWLNLWIHEMMTDFLKKSTMEGITVQLKAKEMYVYITERSGNGNPSLTSAG